MVWSCGENVQLVQVCKVFREKQQDNKSNRPIFHFHIKSLHISAAASNLYVIFDKRMISNKNSKKTDWSSLDNKRFLQATDQSSKQRLIYRWEQSFKPRQSDR